jgi:hypothetical protein
MTFFYYSVPNHQHHKDILLPKLEKDKERGYGHGDKCEETIDSEEEVYRHVNGTCITTGGMDNVHLFHKEFVNDVLWNSIHHMVKDYNTSTNKDKIQTAKITDIWWNYYEPNHTCTAHRHNGRDFSGVYLLHLEEPNPTMFVPLDNEANKMPVSVVKESIENGTFDGAVSTDECREGDVIIFPGMTTHWTTPIQTPRWVVVFDINVTWTTS